jgi:hypothetical protein
MVNEISGTEFYGGNIRPPRRRMNRKLFAPIERAC